MKLSRLYSNKPDIFEPIHFNSGLSVILAEIKRPENAGKTVHNLGKSTVGRLVDFCLLKKKHGSFFLYAHSELFEGFTFFLQLELDDGSFITVARSLESRNAVSVLKSADDVQDAGGLSAEMWAHIGLGIAPAKRLLDGLLGFAEVDPYDYRDLMGYVLREQDDYGDVFHLGKFRGKQREWKPFLSHILGFDASLTVELYDEIEREEDLIAQIERRRWEGGASGDTDVARLEGIIAIRNRELSELTSALDSFDFARADAEVNQELVEDVENQIAQLNEETYRLSRLIWRLDESLREESVLFSSDEVSQLFLQAGVAFEGQLKHSLEQLVEFNRAISEERRIYLLEERQGAQARVDEIEPMLGRLQHDRADLFVFLEKSDTLEKYKQLSSRAVALRADISSLVRQRDALNEIVQLRQDQRQVQERKNHLQTAIEIDVQTQVADRDSRYVEIQRYFDEIVHTVLDDHALLTVSVASTGSLQFSADVVNEAGGTTSAGRGFTYKKLLCIAFDLAVLRAYSGQSFPRFAFHDGVFESLETRAKRRLVGVLRDYSELGLQPIITTLDSDLAEPLGSSAAALTDGDVVRRLNDDGDGGRLFKMAAF